MIKVLLAMAWIAGVALIALGISAIIMGRSTAATIPIIFGIAFILGGVWVARKPARHS
jgi:hypothetical protein